MSNPLSNLFVLSFTGSMVVVLMLLLRPVTAKLFPASWQYRIGKMAIAFFLVPVSFFLGKLSLLVPQSVTPSGSSGALSAAIPKAVQANGLLNAMDSLVEMPFLMTMERHLSIEKIQMILCIWLVGAVAFAAWHFYCYRRFMKQIQENSIPAPENVSALLSSCKTALGIHSEVKIMQNMKIASPMLVGLSRPIILLPAANMQEIDLKLILTHELTHLKRKDLWVKALVLLAGILHWFNPFVYVLRKDISRWSELSCDEELAMEMSREERRLYGEAILNTLDIHSGINTTFCSFFCESKKYIERRLTMLLNAKKMKKHIAVFAIAVILAVGGTGIAFAAGSAEIANDDIVNAAVEKTESKQDISIDRKLTESKQVINVDRETLESSEFVCLGEYTLEEGDLIAYNLTAEGEGNINAAFYKGSDSPNSDGYLGYAMYAGNSIINKNFNMKVNEKLAGTYYLWVGNFEGATLNNLKGTVEIAVERQQAE